MLPIRAWRIYYADGSTFSSDDGTWAEAPGFGVECVVYYHVPPYDRDLDQRDDGIYVYQGDSAGGLPCKLGLWRDNEGHFRILKAARDDQPPRWLPE